MKSVGIWAASSPSTKEQLNLGLEQIQNYGLNAVIPKLTKKFATRGLSKTQPFLAGPDLAKVQALRSLLANSKIIDILCVRGGYGALRLLPLLDMYIPKSAGKIRRKFWGYSDSTIVQMYFFQRFGFSWVHSPMITGTPFQKPTPREAKVWKAILANETVVVEHSLKRVNPGQGKSPPPKALFIGGNLSSLVSMLGSPWEPDPKKDFFLFIEDIHEDGRRLDRLLTQLSNSKFFSRCRAVICGHFTQCSNHKAIIKLWSQSTNVAVFSGFPAGHESPNLPFVMGVQSKLKIGATKAVLEVPNPHFEC